MAELTRHRCDAIHAAISKVLAATMFLTSEGELFPETDAVQIHAFMEQLIGSIRGNRGNTLPVTWRDCRLLMLGTMEECKRRLEARDA